MNTSTRRFILRLIVGLLTFVIGVAAAMALGGFRPFQNFGGQPSYRYKSYRYYKSASSSGMSESDVEKIYPSCRAKRGHARVDELLPPPPPPAVAR